MFSEREISRELVANCESFACISSGPTSAFPIWKLVGSLAGDGSTELLPQLCFHPGDFGQINSLSGGVTSLTAKWEA